MDQSEKGKLVEKVLDPGVDDKRLLALVPEFAQMLGVIARKDNTLSPVLRDLWDRGDAQTTAKNSPERTSGALISVVAHITPAELRARLDKTEIANGFANRFLFIAARRSKLLPRGGNVPDEILTELVPRLGRALEYARKLSKVDMAKPAWELWDAHYESLTTRPPGLVGEATGRAGPNVRRLALIFALMDERPIVQEEHLRAAMELWRYVEDSVRWVFGDRFGDQLADHILDLIEDAGDAGLTRNELRQALGHRVKRAHIDDALRLIEDASLAMCVRESTDGRPVERWYAVEDDRR